MADARNRRNSKNDKPYRRPRKKVCNFCVDKIDEIDYKDVEKLKRYVSDKGKILPRRVTGTCAKHQRKVTNAIQRARLIANVFLYNSKVILKLPCQNFYSMVIGHSEYAF